MTGAEKLKGAQFIARLDGEPVKGVAFWPKDAEIVRFLADHPVQALPSGFVVPQGVPVVGEVVTREQRIRELNDSGVSLNEIQRQVFGFTGGQAYSTVKSVLGSTTTGSARENVSVSAD